MHTLPKVLCIIGPTSSGKTALSLALAKKFNGEIINADARQIYRGFDIGTGKAKGEWIKMYDQDVYSIEGISHHLIDHASPNAVSTVAEWKTEALKCVHQIIERKHLPMIVGGTGLYIQSLVDSYEMPSVPPQPALRERMSQQSLSELVEELRRVDPISAQTVDLKNPRRVMRAIEVATVSGTSFFEQRQKKAATVDPLFIAIEWTPEELRERINKTIDQMLEKGWIDEVKSLHEQGIEWGAPAMTSLGYREIGAFLREEISREQMIEKIKIYTWQYAKRQMTWFRKEKRIHWIKTEEEAERLIQEWMATTA